MPSRAVLFLLCACLVTPPLPAATIRVPQDQPTIQAAIDAAEPGDTVQVAAGRYAERIRLKPHVVVQGATDPRNADGKGTPADATGVSSSTILDGGGKVGTAPGVLMAEGSALRGFTVTGVGLYDEAAWKKHFDTNGEELEDTEGAVQADSTVAAIEITGVECVVENNIVHHNGDVGIAVRGTAEGKKPIAPLVSNNRCFRNMGGGIGVAEGAEAIVRNNTCYENLRAGIGCRNASPLIAGNTCFGNVRAGIGCREGARPTIQGNSCYRNRRAGIGIRMAGTAPTVVRNECYENEMAGIGCRDGAEPIIRDNRCRRNKMAGIGCDGAKPLIVGNRCEENAMAGIGIRDKGQAILRANICRENKLVAVGVIQQSTATLIGNDLKRTGGVPPLVAVKDGSTAHVQDNQLAGGGVAALLVQGDVTAVGNSFQGAGEGQGSAIWVWEGSRAHVFHNTFRDYRNAVNAGKSTVVVANNRIAGFQPPAIIAKDGTAPAHVFGNVVESKDERVEVVKVQGPAGVVADNVVKNAP